MAYLLCVISLAAFVYAARLALGMGAGRRATVARIERATRPAHGGPVIRRAPAHVHNRPGEN